MAAARFGMIGTTLHPRPTRDGRNVFFSRRVTEADIYLLTFE